MIVVLQPFGIDVMAHDKEEEMQRYSVFSDYEYEIGPTEKGILVLYSDAKAIEEERDRLKAEIAAGTCECSVSICDIVIHNNKLKGELAEKNKAITDLNGNQCDENCSYKKSYPLALAELAELQKERDYFSKEPYLPIMREGVRQ